MVLTGRSKTPCLTHPQKIALFLIFWHRKNKNRTMLKVNELL